MFKYSLSFFVLICSLASTAVAKPLLKIHVFVALCDNDHQGIVPTTKTLGDGTNPRTNLYWGAMYGLKTYFRKAKEWTPVEVVSAPERSEILDRCAFFGHGAMLFAEAYDGRQMALTIDEFLASAAGKHRSAVALKGYGKLSFGREANLVFFIGHNGLMDFSLKELPKPATNKPTAAVVLACKSHSYFTPILRHLGCLPLLMTNGFMAPEAYTVAAIVKTWAQGGADGDVHEAAAQAYAKYQKHCSLAAARRLFRSPRAKPLGVKPRGIDSGNQ